MSLSTTELRSFVGRQAELARLRAFLEEVLGGHSAICFVTGEAGAGKSALLEEFCRQAQRADPNLVAAIGDCNAQSGTGDPYLPFREVLAQLTGDVEGRLAEGKITSENANRLRRLFHSSRRILVQHGPDLLDLFVPAGSLIARLGGRLADRIGWTDALRERFANAGERAAGPDRRVEQAHIFEQFTNVLRALAAERPIVLALDDLQWADAGSADLLFHLGRRLGPERILLIGAYRSEDVEIGRGGSRHPLESVLNELRRVHGDVWISLDPGNGGRERLENRPPGTAAGELRDGGGAASREPALGDRRRFLDALVDMEPNRLDDPFRAALFARTGGHPLFTLELLRSLRERGDLSLGEDGVWILERAVAWNTVPPRVEAVIGERIGRLDPTPLELLRIAAVEGEEFTAEVVARVAGTGPREAVRELSGPLSRRHRLVRAQGFDRAAAGRLSLYRFQHSLFQQFLYDTMDEAERRYLHAEVGAAIRDLHADDERVAFHLARHFERAADEREAIRCLRRAGDRARRLHAHVDARKHYERAIALLASDHGDPARRRELSASLHEGVGDLLELAGRHRAARAAYDTSLELLGERSAAEGGAPGTAVARLHRKRARTWERLMRLDEALEALGRAEETLERSESPERSEGWWQERIELWLATVWIHYWRADETAMAEVSARLAPAVERHGTPVQRIRSLASSLHPRFRRERYRLSKETEELAETLVAASRELGDPLEEANSLFLRGFTALWRDDLERAEADLEQALGLARRAGDHALWTRALTYLAVVHRRTGRVEHAEEVAGRALEAAEAGKMSEYVGMARANLAWVAWRRGERGEAASLAEEALRAWDGISYEYPMRWGAVLLLTALAAEAADPMRAVTLLRSISAPPQMRWPEELAEAIEAALAAGEGGDTDTTARRVRYALELARKGGWL